MLKNIPNILSPALLAVLQEMGHGDTLVIGDGNFPGTSVAAANGAKIVRADGHGVCVLLDAILQLMPLDEHVQTPAMLMDKAERDRHLTITIWDEYRRILEKHAPGVELGFYERFAFYEQAKRAFCVVQSGESAIYANILLQKGVVK